MTTKIINIDEKNVRGQANFRLSKPMLDTLADVSRALNMSQADFLEFLFWHFGEKNPFAMIHPELRACLTALRAWRDKKYPDSPWFFPSPVDPATPIGPSSLSHWMVLKGSAVVGRKRTAHGLRAYYVTVRRSQGISDAQIAAEIGDATGAAIIASTYGAIPPNWQGSSTPLSWTAQVRAWDLIPK